jgi:hypothetical protein
MKKIMVFLCFFVFGSVAFAQAPSNLKGPAAKNYKAWKDKADQAETPFLVSVDKPQLTGPAAKNKKVWQKKDQQSFRQLVSTRSNDLKGPHYKNRKHGKRYKASKVDFANDVPINKSKKNSTNAGQ